VVARPRRRRRATPNFFRPQNGKHARRGKLNARGVGGPAAQRIR
jgi:hypothetical protein